MTTPEPLTGDHHTVTRAALALARSGDHRARPAIVSGHRGVLSPHRRDDGTLDDHDLAAQIWALAHGITSPTGHYTDGLVLHDGQGTVIYAPPADDDQN